MYIRSLSATATDGRWEWYASGTPFEFEAPERYTRRRKRDRFDRELLLDYLEHLASIHRWALAVGGISLVG